MLGRWIFLSGGAVRAAGRGHRHISTDVAAAPLMWVIPLSLYLLTWVLVFARRPMFRNRSFCCCNRSRLPASSCCCSSAAGCRCFRISPRICWRSSSSPWPVMANSRAAGRQPAHLTAFYVALSFGGMVGGLFAGLVAPYAFSWVAEYPILVVLAVLCRPSRRVLASSTLDPRRKTWLDVRRWFWPVAAHRRARAHPAGLCRLSR